MQYGQRYKILRTDQSIVEGEFIQTKGDDDNYPTFLLNDGSRLGAHRDNVLGPVDDSAPPNGIERPAEIEHEHERPELWTGYATFDTDQRPDSDIPAAGDGMSEF